MLQVYSQHPILHILNPYIKYFDKDYEAVDDAEAELVDSILEEYDEMLMVAGDLFEEMESKGA